MKVETLDMSAQGQANSAVATTATLNGRKIEYFTEFEGTKLLKKTAIVIAAISFILLLFISPPVRMAFCIAASTIVIISETIKLKEIIKSIKQLT